MRDPVVASDGITYERVAIEAVLAQPHEERRKSPLTREPLQLFLFPNRALRQRIAAHEKEVEAAAERAAQKTLEIERAKVAKEQAQAGSKRRVPPGAEVIELDDSPGPAGQSGAASGSGQSGAAAGRALRSKCAKLETKGFHPRVYCDKSGQCPIVGWRYHLKGKNYDLCEAEYNKLPDTEKPNYEKIAPPKA